MSEKADNKAIGISFMLAGVGLMLSLGITVGWVFAPAGAGLAIVGLVYLTQDGESE